MKKNFILLSIAFLLGLIVSGIGVYAFSINSKDVSYNNTTVEGALDELYQNSGGGKVKEYISFYGLYWNTRLIQYDLVSNSGMIKSSTVNSNASGCSSIVSQYSEMDFKYLDLLISPSNNVVFTIKAKKSGRYRVVGSINNLDIDAYFEAGDEIISTTDNSGGDINRFGSGAISIFAQ